MHLVRIFMDHFPTFNFCNVLELAIPKGAGQQERERERERERAPLCHEPTLCL